MCGFIVQRLPFIHGLSVCSLVLGHRKYTQLLAVTHPKVPTLCSTSQRGVWTTAKWRDDLMVDLCPSEIHMIRTWTHRDSKNLTTGKGNQQDICAAVASISMEQKRAAHSLRLVTNRRQTFGSPLALQASWFSSASDARSQRFAS